MRWDEKDEKQVLHLQKHRNIVFPPILNNSINSFAFAIKTSTFTLKTLHSAENFVIQCKTCDVDNMRWQENYNFMLLKANTKFLGGTQYFASKCKSGDRNNII